MTKKKILNSRGLVKRSVSSSQANTICLLGSNWDKVTWGPRHWPTQSGILTGLSA